VATIITRLRQIVVAVIHSGPNAARAAHPPDPHRIQGATTWMR
jgi:hypothetical protein